MQNLNLVPDRGTPLKLLCLGAHADDIEIGSGGTILTLKRDVPRLNVHWVVFCSNAQRAGEARDSAERFLDGVTDRHVTVHDMRDGFLPYNGVRTKEAFEEIKTQIDPDLILTPYLYDRHQDHRIVSDLTWNTFRSHLILEYEIPKYDGDMGTPNAYVQLDRQTIARKCELILRSFPSQKGKQWFSEDTFVSLLRLRGIETGGGSGYAEAFYCRKSVVGFGLTANSERRQS